MLTSATQLTRSNCNDGGKKMTSTTAILIAESVLFGLTNLPAEIYYIIKQFGDKTDRVIYLHLLTILVVGICI